jgi:hypothetical protein
MKMSHAIPNKPLPVSSMHPVRSTMTTTPNSGKFINTAFKRDPMPANGGAPGGLPKGAGSLGLNPKTKIC